MNENWIEIAAEKIFEPDPAAINFIPANEETAKRMAESMKTIREQRLSSIRRASEIIRQCYQAAHGDRKTP